MHISKARKRITLANVSRKITSKDAPIMYTLMRIKHILSISKMKSRKNWRSKSSKNIKHSTSELQTTFCLYDKNGDGKIKSSELGVIMQSLGANPSKDQVDEIITREDLNGLSIDFHKFVELMGKYLRAHPMDHVIYQAFEALDNDEDGYIDVEKLRQILTTLGQSLDQQEFDEWIQGVGVHSNNGDVPYEDIITPMVKI